VLAEEFSALYGAYRQGQPDPLPPLAVQYADYAAWQRRWLAGEVLQRQLTYWRTALARAPQPLEVPTDRPRPTEPRYAGGSVEFELDEELTRELKALGKQNGATLHMTLLAGWAALLSRLSGQKDVIIGTPVANRTRSEIEGLIGFFVNMLAIRVDLSEKPTVSELIQRVKARALEAQEHQDLPFAFERVVTIQPPRSLAHAPMFRVVFGWQNFAYRTMKLPGLSVVEECIATDTAKRDLSLMLMEVGGRIIGGLQYATALFDRATVTRYLGYFRSVLEGMVRQEGQLVDRLEL
jgi:non-ribosomal peptide synthetase component F